MCPARPGGGSSVTCSLPGDDCPGSMPTGGGSDGNRSDRYEARWSCEVSFWPKEVSPVELLDRTLERLEQVEPLLNSFVTVTEAIARPAARAAEKAVLDGDASGLLHGLPISVKDLIAMEGVRCTFGSKSAADNVATLDAPAVERVRAAGAVIVGKTTTSEFGCKAVGDSPLTGTTRNPWNPAKTPGGSSAGAAASVAAGVTPFALGTDGGGSVRIPGSLTGLFTIKPQFATSAGLSRIRSPDARPCRSNGPHGPRCRPVADCDRGLRSARSVFRGRTGARLSECL